MPTGLKHLFWDRSPPGRELPWPAQVVNAFIVLLAVSLGFYLAFRSVAYHWAWQPVWAYRGKFVSGWLTTVGISAAALVLSTCIGTVTALLRRTAFLPLRYLGIVYVELIRSTPLLVQILIFFYVVANAVGIQSRYLAGTLILSLFAGAYISEIIRAGIDGIPATQIESAKAIGLTRPQIYRFVIFPQAIRHMLPPLAGQFVSLIKDSSLLSIISISELTLNAEEVNSFTYGTLECYLPLALGYLVLTLPLSLWTKQLERRFRYET